MEKNPIPGVILQLTFTISHSCLGGRTHIFIPKSQPTAADRPDLNKAGVYHILMRMRDMNNLFNLSSNRKQFLWVQ